MSQAKSAGNIALIDMGLIFLCIGGVLGAFGALYILAAHSADTARPGARLGIGIGMLVLGLLIWSVAAVGAGAGRDGRHLRTLRPEWAARDRGRGRRAAAARLGPSPGLRRAGWAAAGGAGPGRAASADPGSRRLAAGGGLWTHR